MGRPKCETNGSEPWEDGPDTIAGGSFGVAVAELVADESWLRMERQEKMRNRHDRAGSDSWVTTSNQDPERKQELEDSWARSDSEACSRVEKVGCESVREGENERGKGSNLKKVHRVIRGIRSEAQSGKGWLLILDSRDRGRKRL